MLQEFRKVYTKVSAGKWELSGEINGKDEASKRIIYESLAHDLINKKICACKFIKSIFRENMYDGTQQITVHYMNDVKAVYQIHE